MTVHSLPGGNVNEATEKFLQVCTKLDNYDHKRIGDSVSNRVPMALTSGITL